MTWEYWGFFGMLAAAFLTDMLWLKIPNRITLTGLITGVLCHVLTGGWTGAVFSAKGAVTGFGLMFVLYLLRAVGGGDVKLFAGIGAWMGIKLTLSIMMYSILAAGCIGILILIWKREVFSRLRKVLYSLFGAILLRSMSPIRTSAEGQLQFPFMLAVLPGAIVAVHYI